MSSLGKLSRDLHASFWAVTSAENYETLWAHRYFLNACTECSSHDLLGFRGGACLNKELRVNVAHSIDYLKRSIILPCWWHQSMKNNFRWVKWALQRPATILVDTLCKPSSFALFFADGAPLHERNVHGESFVPPGTQCYVHYIHLY